MSVFGVLLSCLTVFMRLHRMLFRFLVFTFFVVMDSLAMMVSSGLVMSGRIMMRLTGSMFHGHEIGPFEEINVTQFAANFDQDISAIRWQRRKTAVLKRSRLTVT